MTIYKTDPTIGNEALIAWNDLVPDATLAASTEATGYPVTGLLNGVTTDPWKPTAMPATITITLDAAAGASCLCFAAHDMATQGVTVTLERYTGSAWVTVQATAPENDRPFMMAFPEAVSDQWRVTFSGVSTFRVAVMHLSSAMTVPGRVQPPHVPLHQCSTIDLVGDTESGTGEFLQADFERYGGQETINFSVQRADFATGDELHGFRQHYNLGRPFFIACFPEFAPDDMGYCWRASGASSVLVAYNDAVFMGLGMTVSVYHG